MLPPQNLRAISSKDFFSDHDSRRSPFPLKKVKRFAEANFEANSEKLPTCSLLKLMIWRLV